MTKLRQLWLLTALGALAVLAGGYFLLVTPQSTKAAEIGDEADTQEQVNQQLTSQIAMLNKQKKDLPAQQAELAKFATKIPSTPALPSLIRALSDAADNTGVELLAISPTLPTWSKGVNPATGAETGRVDAPNGQVLVTIPVSIEVIGKYSQLSLFFGEIESLNRALLVESFTMSPNKAQASGAAGTAAASSTSTGLLSVKLSTNALMTAKAPAAAPVAAPADPGTDAK